MGLMLTLLLLIFGGTLMRWVLNPETSPWTEGRWRMSVPLVVIVTIGTWTFWLVSGPLMLMAAFFMPYISLGIPAGIAVLLAVAGAADPEFKALWKWYGLTLLTILGATIALFVLVPMLNHLPQWEECRFKVALEVDTPEGVRTASNVYRIKTNRIESLRQNVSGRQSMEGGDFVLDLGARGRVDVSLVKGRQNQLLHYPEEVFGRTEYRRGKTGGRVELTGDLRPELTGERDGRSMSLRPEDFEEFFGPGVRFRRAWLEMVE